MESKKEFMAIMNNWGATPNNRHGAVKTYLGVFEVADYEYDSFLLSPLLIILSLTHILATFY